MFSYPDPGFVESSNISVLVWRRFALQISLRDSFAAQLHCEKSIVLFVYAFQNSETMMKVQEFELGMAEQGNTVKTKKRGDSLLSY